MIAGVIVSKNNDNYNSNRYIKGGVGTSRDEIEYVDSWSYATEARGVHVAESRVLLQLTDVRGVHAAIDAGLDLRDCWRARLALYRPTLRADNAHIIVDFVPGTVNRIPGVTSYILGYDNFTSDIGKNLTEYDMYLTDAQLESFQVGDTPEILRALGGAPATVVLVHTHTILEKVPTPAWILDQGEIK